MILPRRVGDVAFAERIGVGEEDRPHLIFFEVHHQRVFVAADVEEFPVLDVRQSLYREYAVPAGDDSARVGEAVFELEAADLGFEFFGNRAVNANRFHG